MSAGKQAGRPFLGGERGELFQKPSKGNQKLRIPLRGKTQATQSDQTGSSEFRCGRKSGVAEICCLLRVEESARLDFGVGLQFTNLGLDCKMNKEPGLELQFTTF